MKLWILSLLLLVFVEGRAWAEMAEVALYNEANGRYRAGKYAEAAQRYETALKQGVQNGHVYYNLGNAYFKLDRIGESILWYERARLLEPRDPDIAANLQFANLVKKDRDEASDESMVVAVLRHAYETPSLNELSVILTLALVAVLGMACWRLWAAERGRAVWLGCMASGAAVVILAALFLGARAIDEADAGTAIVTVAREIARSAPDANETVVFVIHEGTKVTVQREEKGWVLVRLENGFGGWLPGGAISVI